jgi:hypothetical protein
MCRSPVFLSPLGDVGDREEAQQHERLAPGIARHVLFPGESGWCRRSSAEAPALGPVQPLARHDEDAPRTLVVVRLARRVARSWHLGFTSRALLRSSPSRQKRSRATCARAAPCSSPAPGENSRHCHPLLRLRLPPDPLIPPSREQGRCPLPRERGGREERSPRMVSMLLSWPS